MAAPLAACTAGHAHAPPATDVAPDDWARADEVLLGEDALWSRRETGADGSPWDIDEPAELDAEAVDPASLVLDEDFGGPTGADVPSFGVGAWPPPTARELTELSAAGVEHVRVFLPYVASEDYGAPASDRVAAIDSLFADAARAEVTLLPVLIATDAVPGLDDDALTRWGDFAFWASDRYGDGGELWEERPELPARPPFAWEVWSEPNHPAFWLGEVDPAHYRMLLLYARAGLRDGDPSARVVVGGLAPSSMAGATPPAAFLRGVLDSPDAEQLFEAVSVHPFAGHAEGAMAEIGAVRGVLDERGLGDAAIWITAAGWGLGPAPGAYVARDEAEQASRLRELFDAIDVHRDGWRIGPVFWLAHRDRTIEELGGLDSWARRAGIFSVEAGSLRPRPALGVALEPRVRPTLPILRPAPGRTGTVRTYLEQRAARRDAGAQRTRGRARRRAFRRTVIARMYQLGTCVNGEGHLRADCEPWTLPAADAWEVARYPDLDERRAAYVCDALRRLDPQLVSGLVRYGADEALSTDPGVRAEIEREAHVFRMVRGCVREGRRHPVRFDVVLNTLHFTHEAFGIRTGDEGAALHRAVLRETDDLFQPDAWFYDFYTDPFEPGARTDPTCYVHGTTCGTFHPDGMTAGIRWIHQHGRWVGGNTFHGEGIPNRTDYVSITSAGGMQALAHDRDRARQGHPDLPILMHLRNDPQLGCSEGLRFIHRDDAYRRDLMRRHVRNQSSIGYGYMFPAFFPLRFVRRDPTPDPERCDDGGRNFAEVGRVIGIAAYDARAEGQLAWMRWQMDHRRSNP